MYLCFLLFQKHPDAQYWFEPLDGVYKHLYGTAHGIFPLDINHHVDGTRRKQPQYEQDLLLDTLEGIFDCDMDKVPHETAMHRFVFGEMKATEKYEQCLRAEALKAADALAVNTMMKKMWLMNDNDVVRTVICPHINDQHG